MDKNVLNSWEKNAAEWIKVIDAGEIQSRAYTNKAILNELGSLSGTSVLDIGCGEGWLTRSITKMGKIAVGIDGIESLLANARTKGTEVYQCLTYNDISSGVSISESPFDIAVYNFCLYQKEGIVDLLKNTKNHLGENGCILIQTLHPFFLFAQGLEYKSQTIENSWKGLPGNFTDGHEWYARTFEDWTSVISASGMLLNKVTEVLNNGNKPISLILNIS